MNLKSVVVIAIGIASASQAGAQRVAAIGVIRHEVRNRNSALSENLAVTPNTADMAFRFLSSAGIATGAAIVLGHVGADMEGPCSCDDPGLEGALLGVLTGLLVGAPLGAAAPSFDSVCSFPQRFGRTFLGSLAGTAVGVLTLSAGGTPAGLIAVPIFAAAGGVVSLGPCLHRRGG